MRKRVFLLAVFICCNLVFTAAVISEGSIVSDVSNIPLAAVTINTAVENVQPTELTVNTAVEKVQPAELTVNTIVKNVQPAAVIIKTVVTDAQPTAGDFSKELPTATLKAEEVTNPADNPVDNPKVDIKTGTIKLSYKSENNTIIKVLVEKDGTRYQYNLRNDGVSEFFPLQLGNGDYTVNILENTEGSKYKYISTQVVKLKLDNDKDVFLNSNQQINWDYTSKATLKALELTSGLNDAEAKIAAIYEFITNNFVFDFDRYNNVPSTYLPNIDSILEEGKGICYDYSSLFAAMLRSVGIEAKLIKGYTDNVSGYHAWNEVYNAETGDWLVIDTTYDSTMLKNGNDIEMAKDSTLYIKKYEF